MFARDELHVFRLCRQFLSKLHTSPIDIRSLESRLTNTGTLSHLPICLRNRQLTIDFRARTASFRGSDTKYVVSRSFSGRQWRSENEGYTPGETT